MRKFYTPEDVRLAVLQYRKDHIMTITDFSKLTGVARQTINELNNNRLGYITPKTIKKLKKHNVI